MHSDEVVILAQGLGKTYRLFGHSGDRVKQFFSFGLRQYHRNFVALQDISFDVRKGETVGIIGQNGSGKSTLLQLICGILKPTSGTLEVHGRISALLELGAGFNPEFTGRENVYFQGAVQGLERAAMDSRFDQIAAFADIGQFMDQPVRTYSSGMFVRLAFAVAAHVDPDILVIDEALAVGDSLFQKRCYARIQELQKQGVSLLIVSHDHELIRNLTTRALLIQNGRCLFWGDTREATYRYRKALHESEARELALRAPVPPLPQPAHTDSVGYGLGGAKVLGLRILDDDHQPRTTFFPGEKIKFELSALIETPLDHLNLSVVLRTIQGLKVYSWGTFNQDIAIWAGKQMGPIFWERRFQPGEKAGAILTVECNLGAGTYEVQVVVSRELDRQFGSQQVLHWRDEIGSFRVEMDPRQYVFGGVCDLRGQASPLD
ncbi:MAG: ABC transporter ATP-binding protein [Burkholderiaceae bacterium]|nr:ABC transporter ATP-binding protein [Burkholderiaceae bacterium]